MKISDYLAPERVIFLKSTTKADALEELIQAAKNFSENITLEELRKAVWEREEMMSTGIGQGIGIPHVRLPGLEKITMAVGISREGIADYESLDNKPVHIIVLIAVPQGQHELYIRLLAEIVGILKREDLRRAIIEAKDASEAYRLLTQMGI
ncbi:MAG: PTS sugar transporter subunit IIA [Planctomycetes bacterium]|nr:PTS sugar transporter subunit IIA [Planctomycetota bacterium]